MSVKVKDIESWMAVNYCKSCQFNEGCDSGAEAVYGTMPSDWKRDGSKWKCKGYTPVSKQK